MAKICALAARPRPSPGSPSPGSPRDQAAAGPSTAQSWEKSWKPSGGAGRVSRRPPLRGERKPTHFGHVPGTRRAGTGAGERQARGHGDGRGLRAPLRPKETSAAQRGRRRGDSPLPAMPRNRERGAERRRGAGPAAVCMPPGSVDAAAARSSRRGPAAPRAAGGIGIPTHCQGRCGPWPATGPLVREQGIGEQSPHSAGYHKVRKSPEKALLRRLPASWDKLSSSHTLSQRKRVGHMASHRARGWPRKNKELYLLSSSQMTLLWKQTRQPSMVTPIQAFLPPWSPPFPPSWVIYFVNEPSVPKVLLEGGGPFV